MQILIVSEKLAVTQAIEPFARQYWPLDTITFVHAVPYSNIKFNYPRGKHLHDYPLVGEPNNGLRAWKDWTGAPLCLAANGKLKKVAMSDEHFKKADLIVYAGDRDHTSALGFEILMHSIFGADDNRHLTCPAVILTSLLDRQVSDAFAQMQPFGQALNAMLAYGRVKRYFDWNWMVNSIAVFGVAMRQAGLPEKSAPMSKYALQLLYAISERTPYTEGVLLRMMRDWPGTGRYSFADSKQRPRLGSMASTMQIVDNLVEASLLSRMESAEGTQFVYKITPEGRRFLKLLHPDCQDLDLPFRLDVWCREGDASKPAIDRYINTIFGKQVRYAAKA